MMKLLRHSRNLWSLCMAGPALLQKQMMHGWNSLLVSRDLLIQSHLLKLHCFSMLNGLPIRQVWFGASQSVVSQPEAQSPKNWVWIQEADVWKIFWSALPPIATVYQERTKCGCTTQCRRRCKCYKYDLPCAHDHTRTDENGFGSLYVCSCLNTAL